MTRSLAPIETLPEVEAFEQAAAQLRAFKAKHHKTFEEYAFLVRQYNDLLESAASAARQKQVTSGDFVAYQDNTQVDGEQAYNLLGHARFLKLGGQVRQEAVYSLPKEAVRRALETKELSEKEASTFYKPGFKYKKPEKIGL